MYVCGKFLFMNVPQIIQIDYEGNLSVIRFTSLALAVAHFRKHLNDTLIIDLRYVGSVESIAHHIDYSHFKIKGL